jgi:outer membrane receptor for ferrienterochelin and colicin
MVWIGTRSIGRACGGGFIVFVFACLPAIACAQGVDSRSGESILFQPIPNVLGASRFEQLVTEAPASVTVLTAQDIEDHGWTTLAEIISAVRGFYVTSDRDYSYVGARGFGPPGDYNGRILLVLDGQRLNENIFDGAYVGTESLVDPALIERIEIIRGASSSLYGTNAFLGVINIVTVRGRTAPGFGVNVEAGSFASRGARVTFGHRSAGGFEGFAAGSYWKSAGEDLYFPGVTGWDGGTARSLDADRRGSVFGKATLGDVTFEVAFVSRRKQVPTAPWGTVFLDPRLETLDEQSLVSMAWSRPLRDGSALDASLALHRYDYEGAFPYEDGLSRDWAHGRWVDAEFRHTHVLGTHRIVVGTEGRHNLRQEQGAGDDGMPPSFSDDTRSDVWALFAQDEWRPLHRLIVNAGLRLDHYETFGSTVNPRVGLLWGTSTGTMVKLLHGTAFRAPTNFELYYRDEESQKSNPWLDPERTSTYEAVLEQSVTQWLRATASVYRQEIDELIAATTDGADGLLVFENLGSVRARGLELEMEAVLSEIDARLSWSWQDARDHATDERLSNSPAHLVKLHLAGPLPANAGRMGIEILGMTNRTTLDGSATGGFTVASINVHSRPLFGGVRIDAGISNAFDSVFTDPASAEHVQQVIPREGRRFRLGLSYTF